MGISKEQALDCLRSADLIGIGMEADAVRRKLHPENVVSYTVDCTFPAGANIINAVEAAGVDSISLTIAPDRTFADMEEALIALHGRLPALRVHGPSAGVLMGLADAARLTVNEAVIRLRGAGLGYFAGERPGIADDLAHALEFHRCAHQAGIPTTAGMVFGTGESLEDRVEHLFSIRAIQEHTGGFIAFTPWIHIPPAGPTEAPTAVEYMRTLAVARMVLDNIENIESNCIAQGLKVLQMALRFGANDAGAIPAESSIGFTEEDLRRVIRDAGFQPVQRDKLYQTMFLNN